jgi:predicted ester cyclase
MTTDENRAIVRRYYDEVLNGRTVAVLDEIAVADYIENDPFPGMGNGREQLKLRAGALLSAFAPCTFKIEDIVAEGDRVAVRWRSRGTQSGEFMGILPTNRSYEIAGIDFHRLADGRMAEHWHVVDQLSQLQQLGLLPSPQGAPA